MEEEKCDNCKFKDSSAWMPPCFGCGYGYNNFESADSSETLMQNGIKYHLSCLECGRTWWSEEAFPEKCPYCGADRRQ